MFRKIMSIVAVTGLTLVLERSTAMAQTYQNPYQTPQPTPYQAQALPGTSVPYGSPAIQPLPSSPTVMLNPQPLPPGVVYRPAVSVYLNPQPLPPGLVYRPYYGVYGYPYGRAYFYGRWRR